MIIRSFFGTFGLERCGTNLGKSTQAKKNLFSVFRKLTGCLERYRPRTNREIKEFLYLKKGSDSKTYTSSGPLEQEMRIKLDQSKTCMVLDKSK